MIVTCFPSLYIARGREITVTWEQLLERLSKPTVRNSKKNAPGISPVSFVDCHRAVVNVRKAYAIGLDFDHPDALCLDVKREPGVELWPPTWDDLTRFFASVDSFLHTTFRATPECPRARVFVRLSRPVTAGEYRRIFTGLARMAEQAGILVDQNAKDASRFWYLPVVPPTGDYRFSIGRGEPLNVEAALAANPAPVRLVPRPASYSGPVGNLEERAAKYLAKCDPAISGQNGHTQTFLVARSLVQGFGLDEETAYRLLLSWNERCQPPWSERLLRRKVEEAAAKGTMAVGALRDRPLPRRAS